MKITRFSKTQYPQLSFITKDIFYDDGQGNITYFWWLIFNTNQIILDDGDFIIQDDLDNVSNCIKLTDYNLNSNLRLLIGEYASQELKRNFWATLLSLNTVDRSIVLLDSLQPVVLAINNSEFNVALEILNNETPTTDLLTEELKGQLASLISDEISLL